MNLKYPENTASSESTNEQVKESTEGTIENMRHKIIEKIKSGLESDDAVFALWLEGADSLNTVDEFSDIDVVADVKDGEEDRVLQKIENILSESGNFDLNWEAPRPNSSLRYKIFHIVGTSEHLIIDVNVQSHSREFEFTEGNPYEKPFVLFDKAGVIKYQKVDQEKIKQEMSDQIPGLEALFFQRSKIRKSIIRKEFLEAFAYYKKLVLDPVVQLFRFKYAPMASDYGLVHISRHLPPEIVDQIEELYQVSSLEDLGQKLEKAEKLFEEILKDVK